MEYDKDLDKKMIRGTVALSCFFVALFIGLGCGSVVGAWLW